MCVCISVLPLSLQSDSDVVACWLPQTSHPQFREGWIETDSRKLIIEDMVYNKYSVLIQGSLGAV